MLLEGSPLGTVRVGVRLDSVDAALAKVSARAEQLTAAAEENKAEGSRSFLSEAVKYTVVGVVAMCGLLFGISAWIVVRPLKKVIAGLRNIAAGDADLSTRLPTGRRDEIGELAECFNGCVEKFQTVTDEVRTAAEQQRAAQAERAEAAAKQADEQRRQAEDAERKVRHILEVVDCVGRRDYARRLEVEGNDALGQLADGLRRFFANKQETEQQAETIAEKDRRQNEVLRRKVDRLLEVVNAAAQGDLTRSVAVEGNEAIDELAAGLKRMLEDLGSVIGQVTQSAAQFNEGARVIADGSQTLAQGAQTQSTSVEEMSASIESLTRSIEAVKENAREANRVAGETNAAGRSRRRGRATLDRIDGADPPEFATDQRDHPSHFGDRQPDEPVGTERRHRGRPRRRTRHGICRRGRRGAKTGRAEQPGRA